MYLVDLEEVCQCGEVRGQEEGGQGEEGVAEAVVKETNVLELANEEVPVQNQAKQ